MEKTSVSLVIKFRCPPLMTSEEMEAKYQRVWRHVATFFHRHPNNRAALHVPGRLLLWLEAEHPEFVKAVERLVARGQVETLGGAFHGAVLPALCPVDRSAQLEALTAELRRLFGRRPRGAVLFGSAWENTLVSTLQSCGFEYALLDRSAVARSASVPYVCAERGKSVRVILTARLPLSSPLPPAADFVGSLLREAGGNGDSAEIGDSAGISVVCVEDDDFPGLLGSLWLESFFFVSRNNFREAVSVVTPREAASSTALVRPLYVAAALEPSFGEPTVFDFLLSHPECKSLYDRMMHVSLLISQCRGDRARRQEARELLWEAQDGEAYLSGGVEARQRAWRLLSEAEMTAREASGFSPMAAAYDYDGDGREELVCSMERYVAVVSSSGARISEFCAMKPSGNYAGGGSARGLFASRLLTDEEFGRFRGGSEVSGGAFAGVFPESSFSATRSEARFLAEGEFLGRTVSMSKKFVANPDGFTVQVILRSSSDGPVSGFLTVESDFARTGLSQCGRGYGVDAVLGSGSVSDGGECGELSDVSLLQVTDRADGISFVFEPNENCSAVLVRRPDLSLSAALCWRVELGAGKELEKTVSFAVVAPKRGRR